MPQDIRISALWREVFYSLYLSFPHPNPASSVIETPDRTFKFHKKPDLKVEKLLHPGARICSLFCSLRSQFLSWISTRRVPVAKMLVSDRDPPEVDPETRSPGLVLPLGDDARKHPTEGGRGGCQTIKDVR